MDDDCYLPFHIRSIPLLTRSARLICASPDKENLRNGVDRPVGENDNGAYYELGDEIEYRFDGETEVSMVRIVWDSDLNREIMPEIKGKRWSQNMLHNRSYHSPDFYAPKTMTKSYRIEGVKAGGATDILFETANNYQRLNKIPVSGAYESIRLIPLETWGSEKVHIFAFDVE